MIVKRLEKLERIKQENREKLNRQLKEIEKSEQLIMSRVKGESVSVYERGRR